MAASIFEYRVTEYLERLFHTPASALRTADRRAQARQHRGPPGRCHSTQRRRPAGDVRSPSRHCARGRHDDRALDAGGARRPAVRPRRVRHQGGHDGDAGAVARLAEERPPSMPTIVMACTVNEEHGYTGATALAELWSQPGSIFPRRPDAAIVAEPTELQVVVAHKGRCPLALPRPRPGDPQLAAASGRERHLQDAPRAGGARALSARNRAAPGPASALRQHHAQRGHDHRRHQREHRARPMHDRNRSPPGSRRKPRRSLRARDRIHQD